MDALNSMRNVIMNPVSTMQKVIEKVSNLIKKDAPNTNDKAEHQIKNTSIAGEHIDADTKNLMTEYTKTIKDIDFAAPTDTNKKEILADFKSKIWDAKKNININKPDYMSKEQETLYYGSKDVLNNLMNAYDAAKDKETLTNEDIKILKSLTNDAVKLGNTFPKKE